MSNSINTHTHHYGEDPRQCVDLHWTTWRTDLPIDLVVHVHGGAWRSGDKNDHAETLVPNLLNKASGHGNLLLVFPNYRLSPDVTHPAHTLDVQTAIHWAFTDGLDLVGKATNNQDQIDRRTLKVWLTGHSVGAFMVASLALDSKYLNVHPGNVALRAQLKGVMAINGLYDLSSLLKEYPDYLDWVSAAFGNDAEKYAKESPISLPLDNTTKSIKIYILHSRQDELLSLTQPDEFYFNLQSKGQPSERLYDDYEGTHDDVLDGADLPELMLGIIKKEGT